MTEPSAGEVEGDRKRPLEPADEAEESSPASAAGGEEGRATVDVATKYGVATLDAATAAPLGADGKPISKKQLKRIAKRQLVKKKQKEKKKAVQAVKRQKRIETGNLKPGDPGYVATAEDLERRKVNKRRRAEIKGAFLAASDRGPLIVFDFDAAWTGRDGGEGAMFNDEMISLAQQIMFCYGCNRRAMRPVRMMLAGVDVADGSQMSEALVKKDGITSWIATQVLPTQLDASLCHRLAASPASFASSSLAALREVGKAAEAAGGSASSSSVTSSVASSDRGPPPPVPASSPSEALPTPPPRNLVYLTSDAEEVLEELSWENNTTYVIGGIVDRNRLKMATFNKASRLNIRMCKLPLDQYVAKMASTKVLTCNHVFEIMLRKAEGNSWAQAFEKTLPARKDIEVVDGEAAVGDGAEGGSAGGGSEDPSRQQVEFALNEQYISEYGVEGEGRGGGPQDRTFEQVPPWIRHAKFF